MSPSDTLPVAISWLAFSRSLNRARADGLRLAPDDARRAIEAGLVWTWLEEAGADQLMALELSGISAEARRFMTEELKDVHYALGPAELGVEQEGVAMLLGYALHLLAPAAMTADGVPDRFTISTHQQL